MKGKDNLFGLIRNYRSIAKNVEFQDILNEIDSDLHYVTEKSKMDVFLFMQHLGLLYPILEQLLRVKSKVVFGRISCIYMLFLCCIHVKK